MVGDFFLFGIGDNSPLEELSFVIRPVLLDIALSVLRLLTYLLINFICLGICDYLHVGNMVPASRVLAEKMK